MPPQIRTRNFRIEDYEEAISLWQRVEGIEIAEGDEKEDVELFLARNPDLSRVAETAEERVVGVALCGHDGRRGYVYHLAIEPEYQQQGVARQLIAECLSGLRKLGLKRALILVAADNPRAQAFWHRCGWEDVPFASVMGIDL